MTRAARRRALPPLLALAFSVALAAPAETGAVLTGLVTTKDDGGHYPGATVSVPELKLSTTTDRDGRYVLKAPASAVGRSVEVRVEAPGLKPRAERVTLAAGSTPLDFAMSLGVRADVTVGSRAAGAEAEKAVPVDVIETREIASASGSAEVAQILQKLTPSFNFPRPTISDGTDSIRPATIRSLGPDQLLVMLNGKRRHTSALVNVNGTIGRGSAGVDLNAIPAAALDRVEILRDGAAAQYGSDAIAGVLNLGLKSGLSPLGVTLQAGTTTEGDGGLLDLSANRGFALGGGTVNVTAEFRRRGATNRAGNDPRAQGARDPIDQPNTRWGDAATTDAIVFLNASVPVNDDGTTSFYLFGGYGHRDTDSAGNFRRALQAQNWPQIYPNGFLPKILGEVVDASGTAGVRGVLANAWFWDLSLQRGRNRLDFRVADSLNTSLGPNQPPNQKEFYSGAVAFGHWVGNLDVSRTFPVGLAGPLNVALGAEARRESFEQIAGERNSYLDGGSRDQFGANPAPPGAQVFPGFRPENSVDASRTSVAAYADLEGDVTKFLRLGLAGRYEHSSDFGDTTDVKLTARVEAARGLLFRGAASTGFRAPSLHQAYFSTVATNFLNVGGVFQPFDVLTARVDSPVARALGARDLTPEDSTNLSAGLVLSPSGDFDLTADYFNIHIRDRIVFSGNFTGAALNPILQPFGASGVRFFTNAIDTRTDGVELTANYRRDLGAAGTLRAQAAWAHSETTVTKIRPTPPQLAAFQTTLFDRLERRRFECGQPRDTVRLAADWARGPLGAVVKTTRYGSYCGIDNGTGDAPYGPASANDQTFSADWLVDVELSVALLDRIRIAVGADNVFDVVPDETKFVNSNSGINRYPRNSPFGFNGRFVYTRIAYGF